MYWYIIQNRDEFFIQEGTSPRPKFINLMTAGERNKPQDRFWDAVFDNTGYSSDLPNKLRGLIPRVNESTIPTERPLLVGKVSVNFVRIDGCRVVSVTDPYSRVLGFLYRSRYVFWSSSSIVLTRLSGPRSRPTTSQKLWYRRELNPDLSICSQELWPLDHRGGLLSST
jgi:hypothetical protein